MKSYAGRHAELYDLFYSEKPYAAEAKFVDKCLRKNSDGPCQRLLDVACGTGRHAFAFEKLGYKVVAVDHSKDMLVRARATASEAKSKVRFRLADMRTLDFKDGEFDAAVCLFDSIGYVRSTAAVRQTLKLIRGKLRPGGLLVFEYWHAPTFLQHYSPVRVRRWDLPQGQILRISETSLDRRRRLAHVTYSVCELDADGRYRSFEETQSNRYFKRGEMNEYLEDSGFATIRSFGGFSFNKKLDDRAWHVISIARRY
jgi:SAM-dependent methyltransferase